MPVQVVAGAAARGAAAGGKVAAKGAAKTGAAAGKAGARAASKAGGKAASGAARQASRAGTTGARRAGATGARAKLGTRGAGGRTSARPRPSSLGPRGTGYKGQWGNARQANPQARAQPGDQAPDAAQQATDAAMRTAGAVGRAGAKTAFSTAKFGVRTAARLARTPRGRLVLRHAKWARRMLKKKDAKKSKKQQELERRRKRRKRVVIVGIVVLVVAMTVTPGGIGAPSTSSGGGTTYGTVTGIPFADIFNQVAELGIDPRLVAAVAWAESGFDEDVIECRRSSEDGALGIMQFMPGTAAGRGIDPCNPAEAIPAAARYLLEIYDMFHDWELTLAGYNAGPYGEVAGCRCVPENGETDIYVPRVMGKWREYQAQFPAGEVEEGGMPAADCPVDAPQGGTSPVAFANTTEATLHVANEIVKCFGRDRGIGCYDPRGGNGAKYEHPRGRACDMMVTGGGQPSAEQKARGQAMAEWLMANAGNFKVLYIIWHKRVWNPRDGQRPWAEWRNYSNQSSDPYGSHTNHVHVSIALQPGDPSLARCVSGIPCTE